MAARRPLFHSFMSRPLSKGRRRQHGDKRRLGYEALEDRRMMAFTVPEFNSLAGAPITVYLDFDGTPAFRLLKTPNTWASGPAPGDGDPLPAFSIDDNLFDFNALEIKAIEAICSDVAEKFSPFNINVSTVPPPNFDDGNAVHVVIGGSDSDWYKQGRSGTGAYEAFTTESTNAAFCFTKDIIDPRMGFLQDDDRRHIATTIGQEVGHVFGLSHQAEIGAGNMVTVEYTTGNNPNAAPLMGSSGDDPAKRDTWWSGPASIRQVEGNRLVYAGWQDDLAVMTRPGNYVTMRPDDYDEWTNSGALSLDWATGAVNGKGVIERNGDKDAFTFTAISNTIDLTISGAPIAGMLAPDYELILIGVGAAPSVTATYTNTSVSLHANVLAGRSYVLRVKPHGNDYGNLGQYTITGNVGNFATLDPTTGILTVRGFDGVDDNIYLAYRDSDRILVQDNVFGGATMQYFPRSQVRSIHVIPVAGTNHLTVFDGLGSLDIFYAGGGENSGLYLQATNGSDYFHVEDRGQPYSDVWMNGTKVMYSSVDRLELSGFGGNDTFDVAVTPPWLRLRIDGMDGDDTINLAPNDPFASSFINGPVTVFGSAGDDTLHMGSGNADALATNVTFYGGSGDGPFGDAVVFHDENINFVSQYDVGATTVHRLGHTSQTHTLYDYERLVINGGRNRDEVIVRNGLTARVEAYGNDGADVFTRGDGYIVAAATAKFDGGNGNDTLRFDDRLNPADIIWDINQDRILYGGAVPQDAAGFENVAILAGTGNNEITFARTLTQGFDVDGGGGHDTFLIDGATFAAPAILRGGAGNDSFAWSRSENWYPLPIGEASFPVTLDGGADYNSLLVDDRSRGQMSYSIDADRLRSGSFDGRPSGMEVAYDNMQGVTLNLGNNDNFVNVYGTSSDLAVGNQFSILGGRGNDEVRVHPRDAVGKLTINGNLGVSGGLGLQDAVVIDDLASDLPINYSFFNQFGPGTTNVGGLGAAGFGAGNDVESLSVYAGRGDDRFQMISHTAPTQINLGGGDGSDLLDYMSWTGGAVYTSLAGGTATGVHLLSSIERVVSAEQADVTEDGVIDGGDLLKWSAAFGQSAAGDIDGDGATSGFDFLAWQLGLGMRVVPPSDQVAAVTAEKSGVVAPANPVDAIDAAFEPKLFMLPAELSDDEHDLHAVDFLAGRPRSEVRSAYRPSLPVPATPLADDDWSDLHLPGKDPVDYLDLAYADLELESALY
jgi:hypothetical protein